MSLEPLSILEVRVQEMIDLVLQLKEENTALESERAQLQAALEQLRQERAEVRLRVEKMLGTLTHLEGAEESLSEEEGGEQKASS